MTTAQTQVAQTEVPANQGTELPQLDPTTFESQLVWLLLSFVFLFVIVSRAVLPKINTVLENREERIAGDLDTAERQRAEAEEIKAAYEASVAQARTGAQKAAIDAKEKAKVSFTKAQAKLDAKLNAEADKATANIQKATDDALASLDKVAIEVTSDLVAKLSGGDADKAKVTKAVKAAVTEAKGA